jgi:hypothetical protein
MLRIRRSDPGTTCQTGRLTMFDNLIRHDPNDGAKTIIPDLAHSWEIAPDGQTYTFHLRQGVQKCKTSHEKLRLLPSRISKLLPSTVPNNVTVINTRDERGGRIIPVGTNPVAFGSFILAGTLG